MSQAGIINTGGGPTPGTILTLTGTTGGSVSPDGFGNINILSTPNAIVDGDPGTHTLTINPEIWTYQNNATLDPTLVPNKFYAYSDVLDAFSILDDPIANAVIAITAISSGFINILPNVFTGVGIQFGNFFTNTHGIRVNGPGDTVYLIANPTTNSWNVAYMQGNPQLVDVAFPGTVSGMQNSLFITGQGVVYSDGLTGFSELDGISPGFVLTSNGTGVSPSFQAISSSGAIEQVNLQAGTSPIVPTAGAITLNGQVVAAGSTPIRTDGTGISTAAIQVQISQAIAATDATKIGLAAFDSASFAVDANGFVTMAGGGGFTWSNKSVSFNALKNNGYFITGTCTATLPTNASSAIGDTIRFFVQGAFVLTLQAAASQKIQIASNLSSSAGTQVSTANGDAVEIVFNTTANQFNSTSFVGAWNFT